MNIARYGDKHSCLATFILEQFARKQATARTGRLQSLHGDGGIQLSKSTMIPKQQITQINDSMYSYRLSCWNRSVFHCDRAKRCFKNVSHLHHPPPSLT